MSKAKDAAIIQLRNFHAAQVHIVENREKRTIIRCGRRFGKTSMFEDLACLFAVNGKSVGWFSPKYKYMQGSFRRIKACLKPIVHRASITDGIIELDHDIGGIIRFWTLQDEDAGRGDYYHEIFIDEMSLVEKGMRDIWEQSIAPTLLDYDGNAWIAGTPKGIDPDNFFYFAATNKDPAQGQLWKEFHAPTMANPHLNESAIEDFKAQLPPLVYRQEVLAEFIDWSGTNFFDIENLLIDGLPVAMPTFCKTIYAVIDTAMKDGAEHDSTAVIYAAFIDIPEPRVVILDYDAVSINGAFLIEWLPSVYARLAELAEQCKPRLGTMAFVEDKGSGTVLLQQAKRQNRSIRALQSDFVALGKTGRALEVSGAVYSGKVKITDYAYNKTIKLKSVVKNHLISQVSSFKLGIDNKTDDLLDCFCYAINLGVNK